MTALVLTLTMGAGPVFAWHISNTTTGYQNPTGSFVAATANESGEEAVVSATVDPVSGCSSLACGYVAFSMISNGGREGTPSSTSPKAKSHRQTHLAARKRVHSTGFVVTLGSCSFHATWSFNDGSISSYMCPSREPFNIPSSTPGFSRGMATLLLLLVSGLSF